MQSWHAQGALFTSGILSGPFLYLTAPVFGRTHTVYLLNSEAYLGAVERIRCAAERSRRIAEECALWSHYSIYNWGRSADGDAWHVPC